MNRRRNPLRNPTVTDVDLYSIEGTTHFNSVLKARAFINRASCLSESERQQPKTAAMIADAQNVIRKADLRNVRRQIRRYQKKGRAVPQSLIARYKALRVDTDGCDVIDEAIEETCGEIRDPLNLDEECLDLLNQRSRFCESKGFSFPEGFSEFEQESFWHRPKRKLAPSKKRLATKKTRKVSNGHKLTSVRKTPTIRKLGRSHTPEFFEELYGPDGQTLRFKVIHEQGQFQHRTLTNEDPHVGDYVLDMTSGFKAWKVTAHGRAEIPPSPFMNELYRSSYLYKVRQLAAGKISLAEFKQAVASGPSDPKPKKSRKMRRKSK